MYVTKTKAIIILTVLLIIVAQSGAFADTQAEDGSYVPDNFYKKTTHKVRALPGGNGPTHPYYTTQDIERIHDNTTSATITIQESDGDTWYYFKDATTGDYYRALN